MAGPSSNHRRAAAMLLTGGRSRRLGQDKATIVIDGDRLAERTAVLLRQVAAPVIEVGPGYTSLSWTRENPPGSGPLAAVAAGAAALRQLRPGRDDPVLVVATDLPRLTPAFLQMLVEHGVPTSDHSVVPRDACRRAQPLCARYSPAALVVAQELVAAGHRSMTALLERIPVTWLDVGADAEILADIDTPADLNDFQATGSHATGSHATDSHATDSHATGSHATGSQATGSHATGSHATVHPS